jgi:ribosomal protein L2
MLFKKIKPVTPSLRNKIVVKHLISKKFKKLLINKQKMQGRSIFGKITSHHIGGGNYFKYRNCDYKNFSFKIPCIFLGYDYDNFRSG